MCLVKRRSGLPSSEIRVKVRFVDFDDPTQPATWTPGKGLMVCAIKETSSVTHFFSTLFEGHLQKARLSTAIIYADASNGAIIEEAQEDGFTGPGDWSFCDPTKPAPG
jgi:hypothetical protein